MITETTAEQISSFINYAEQRIQKEYEDNERFREENGTDDYLSQPFSHVTMGADATERRELCDGIDKLRLEGMNQKDACASHFVSSSTYHKWRRHFNYPNFYELRNQLQQK